DEYRWGVRQIARRTGRSVGDVSELLNLGDDPELAPIVRDDLIAPTTASEIRRLPRPLRERAVEGVRQGVITRVVDVKRLRADTPVAVAEPAAPDGLFNIEHRALPETPPIPVADQVFNIEHLVGAESEARPAEAVDRRIAAEAQIRRGVAQL